MAQLYARDLDSGYAWVIVFASFALHFQQVAPISTLGIFLIEFADYFQVTKSSLGWIGAFQLSTGYLLGVVIGPISRRVGCRPVVCVGSLLMTSGYLISFFSPNVEYLYVTFGLLTGVGIGCLFIPATIVVQLYFYRRRAFAASIAISGTAVGVFFWPPFCRWMIDIFSWRGGLIIMAAMQLHGIVFGILLRPRPKALQIPARQTNEDTMLPKISVSNSGIYDELRPIKQTCTEHSNSSCSSSERVSDNAGGDQKVQNPHKSTSDISASSGISQSIHSLQISHISEDFTPKHHQTSPHRSKFWKYLPWILFFFGNWLVQSCHVLITVLTPVRAHWFGIETHLAALLVSIYGISSGVFRSLMGWLGDRRQVNRLVLFGVSAILAGACTCISASFEDFWMLALYSFVFGVLAAAYIGLLGAIVVSVFTMEHIALGTGVMSMTVGFANLITHPLAGWLVDLSGGYTLVFVVFGLIQIVGGLFILSIAVLFKFRS